MLQGIGDPWIRTTDKTGSAANNQKMLVLGLLSFELTTDSASKESQRFNSQGELVTATTVKGSTSYGLTLTYNDVDWGGLAFASGQFSRDFSASNVDIPALEFGTVPSTADYEIPDTYITDATDDDITVVITETSGGLPAGTTLTHAATAATPGAGEVGVDGTGNKLVFNAAQAGASIAYPKFTSYSSVADIGGPSGADTWGNFEFYGKVFIPSISAGAIIYFPTVTIATEPTITVNDGVPELAIECGLTTPSGWNKPYRIFNMDEAVAA